MDKLRGIFSNKTRKYYGLCRVLYPNIELKLIPVKNVMFKTSITTFEPVTKIIDDLKRLGPILISVIHERCDENRISYCSTIIGYESNGIFFPIEVVKSLIDSFDTIVDSVTIKHEISKNIIENGTTMSEIELYNYIKSIKTVDNKKIEVEDCFILCVL